MPAYSMLPGQGSGVGGFGAALQPIISALTPDFYEHGGYTPEQMQQWYADSQEGGPQYQRHQDFLKRLTPALTRRYGEFINAWLGGWRPQDYDPAQDQLLTPEEIEYDRWLQSQGIDAKKRRSTEVREGVFSAIGGQPYRPSPHVELWKSRFLDYMRDHSLGGDAAENPVTPEQLAAWQSLEAVPQSASELVGMARDNLNANYRLPEEGKANMERLADYNLMTTFQSDPVHRPAHLRGGYAMGMIQNVVGMLYPDSTGMAPQQLANVIAADPVSAVNNALMWDDHTREKLKEPTVFWNDFLTGSAVPQGSALTAEGMERKFEGGDSVVGQLTRWLRGPMLFPNTTEQQRQDMSDFQSQEDRFVPIRPKGANNAVRSALKRDIRAAEADAWSGFSTTLPEQIRSFNKATGLNIKPFYPSAAVNDLAMVVPALVADPQNIAQTAAIAGAGMLTGGGALAPLAQALLSNVGEIPAEGAFNAAITLNNTPQTLNEYLSAPDPNVPLRTPDGRIPDPALPEYEQALSDLRSQQRKLLGQAGKLLQNDRKKAQNQPKSGSFIESDVFLQPY